MPARRACAGGCDNVGGGTWDGMGGRERDVGGDVGGDVTGSRQVRRLREQGVVLPLGQVCVCEGGGGLLCADMRRM